MEFISWDFSWKYSTKMMDILYVTCLGRQCWNFGWTAMAYVYPHKLGQPYDFGEIDPLSETALKEGGNCSELGNK